MMNASCCGMNTALLAQLAFIIIFFLDLFCQFSPFAPLVEFFKFIFLDQLFDPCFQLVFCYRHKITRFQVASATMQQHWHEGKYANENDTRNKQFVVCCVCRSFTLSLYYRMMCLSIFFVFLPARSDDLFFWCAIAFRRYVSLSCLQCEVLLPVRID